MSDDRKNSVVFVWIKQILLVILLTMLISLFLIQTYNVNDVSMEPTFNRQGNRVLVFLTPYLFGMEPNHGEIVVIDSRADRKRSFTDRFLDSPLVAIAFRSFNEHMWVKRVIGLPGDQLEFSDGSVYRNGQKLDEDYIMGQMRNKFETVIVPDGYVFVMGDNRNRSSDSRQVGPIPVENIQGRVILRFLPLNKFNLY